MPKEQPKMRTFRLVVMVEMPDPGGDFNAQNVAEWIEREIPTDDHTSVTVEEAEET